MHWFNPVLTIDTKRACEGIKAEIRRLLDINSAGGVLIGLSGGMDSAVLSTLAVRAVGGERVVGYYLYDRDSGKKSRQRAWLLADWLGMKLELCDIEPAMIRQRIYAPFIVRMMGFSGFLNRCLACGQYGLFRGEPPFVSSLRRSSGNGGKVGKLLYEKILKRAEAAFNARHIYRRRFLEEKAKEHNRLVLGAANRSECMVGWFVKGGIDDMPFSPLNRLYKTQVRQLASYLGLPAEIQNQMGSPDMCKGITDECALGIGYDALDIVLYGQDHGLSDEQMLGMGVTCEQISHVRMMHKLSAWKRAS